MLYRAREPGNVSAACREHQIPRSLYYRWKRRFERYGADGLPPRRTRSRPPLPEIDTGEGGKLGLVEFLGSPPTLPSAGTGQEVGDP